MKSSELRGFLTGLILGDGTIDKGTTKRSFIIKSTNFDFVEYIERSLKATTNFRINVNEHPGSVKNGVFRKPYKELKVRAHPYFAKRYHFFYDDYRNRRITTKALSWLNPAGLANWWMSDGYITLVGKQSGAIRDRRVELCTDRYSLNDVEKIKSFFENVFNYKIKLVDRKRRNQYRLRISLMDAQKFFLLIEPYIVPSMRYKIYLPYDYQPSWMVDEYYHLMNRLQSVETLTSNVEG